MQVHVTDAAAAESYRLGVELLVALQGREEFTWGRDGESLAWLVGTRRLLHDLKQGRSVEEIVAADENDHRSWREARAPILLY